jgi:peroxiredoxin
VNWLVVGLALAWLAIAVLGILLHQLMLHNGRLLVRVERLESRSGEQPSTPPGHAGTSLGLPFRESRLARDGLSVGTPAPSFRLPRVGGGEVSLDEYRGQSVLLVFSDPGCGPCNQLAPKLERLHRQSLDLEVLMVSRGSPADNAAKIAEHHLTFPVLLQNHWEISRLYAKFATPIAYLVDEHLTVAADVALGADAIVGLASRRPAPQPATSRSASSVPTRPRS